MSFYFNFSVNFWSVCKLLGWSEYIGSEFGQNIFNKANSSFQIEMGIMMILKKIHLIISLEMLRVYIQQKYWLNFRNNANATLISN